MKSPISFKIIDIFNPPCFSKKNATVLTGAEDFPSFLYSIDKKQTFYSFGFMSMKIKQLYIIDISNYLQKFTKK